MGPGFPLGRREGQGLEFKAADALKRPFTISREVVGMLNAGGPGHVWVGIREENGIAVEAETITDAERRRLELLDHLVEVVEPRLQPRDVRVRVVEQDGRSVLDIHVDPRSEGPWALLKEGGRHFLLRVDHRSRPMTREEILRGRRAEEFGRKPRLPSLREKRLRGGSGGLWLGIEPDPHITFDLQARTVMELLLDPLLSGNRSSGWHFAFPSVVDMQPRLGRERLDLGKDCYRLTTIHEDGCIEFWVVLRGLHHRSDPIKEIYPLALLEYSVSIARLAAALYKDASNGLLTHVDLDAALLFAKGWHLPAYPPGSMGYMTRHEPERVSDTETLTFTSPLRLEYKSFDSRPDEAGFRVVRRMYQAFGLPEERLPREYDRQLGKLTLPDSGA